MAEVVVNYEWFLAVFGCAMASLGCIVGVVGLILVSYVFGGHRRKPVDMSDVANWPVHKHD